jgi:CRISPR-associated protein Cas2
VWLVVMFDLPVKTKSQKRKYSIFRNALLSNGFTRLQFSIYSRPFLSEEASLSCQNFLVTNLPPEGQVRLLVVTDRQYGKMKSFFGKRPVENESGFQQIFLF